MTVTKKILKDLDVFYMGEAEKVYPGKEIIAENVLCNPFTGDYYTNNTVFGFYEEESNKESFKTLFTIDNIGFLGSYIKKFYIKETPTFGEFMALIEELSKFPKGADVIEAMTKLFKTYCKDYSDDDYGKVVEYADSCLASLKEKLDTGISKKGLWIEEEISEKHVEESVRTWFVDRFKHYYTMAMNELSYSLKGSIKHHYYLELREMLQTVYPRTDDIPIVEMLGKNIYIDDLAIFFMNVNEEKQTWK